VYATITKPFMDETSRPSQLCSNFLRKSVMMN
jgi:hypothetical protein